MSPEETKKQWHGPFCAAMRLELREDKDCLIFENEYNLSSKPLQIDLLVIKKESRYLLKNEIGRIFRKHNLLEYKSPGDNMDVNTYYKVLGYACFYKSVDDEAENIRAEDITITLVREGYPETLMEYFTAHGCCVEEKYSGIYYVHNAWMFPVQIIVSGRLDKETHIWLTALTRKMEQKQAEALILKMNRVRGAEWRQADAVLNLAMNANEQIFRKVKEENPMCEALMRLMKPEFDAALSKAVKEEVAKELEKEVARELDKAVARELDKAVARELDKAVAREVDKAVTREVDKAVNENSLKMNVNFVERLINNFGCTLEKACAAIDISLDDYWNGKRLIMGTK